MPKKTQIENDSAFKNWINADLVSRMAYHLKLHAPLFNETSFKKVTAQLPALELKPRVRLITEFLKNHLPADYPKALELLLKAALNPGPKFAGLNGFDLWPFTEFIQQQGLDHFNESTEALKKLTPLFTAEFAIRPFLIHSEKQTLKVLARWSQDPDHHVRRLVSEGSRPRLPWGQKLSSFIKDPRPTLELLEKLKYDDELYVRKSVANHLNDISKDHPELAIQIAKEWTKKAPKEQKSKIVWITRHALRTLLKKGHPEALKLFGYETKGQVKLQKMTLQRDVIRIGENIEFSFKLSATHTTKVMVDYIVHHQKANGETTEKVFKLTSKTLRAKESLLIEKKHSFKKVTTRVYHPGTHHIEIMVNGKRLAKKSFTLKK